MSFDGNRLTQVKRGVLQGSLCSPYLFDLYINDLVDSAKDVTEIDNFFLYADDVLVKCLGPNVVREFLNYLQVWSSKSGLDINPSKCGIIKFRKKA